MQCRTRLDDGGGRIARFTPRSPHDPSEAPVSRPMLLRIVSVLFVLAAFVHLHACTSDREPLPASERTKAATTRPAGPAIDPRRLFHSGEAVVTGPDAHQFRLRFDPEGTTV